MLAALFRSAGRPGCLAAAARLQPQFKTQRYVSKLPASELFNPVMARKIVRIKLPGRTLKSQRGLYHNLVVRRGHRISYADNKHPRPYKINVHKKVFFSQILGKRFRVNVSMKALRTIRKYGGFDNYVLLTKPKNLYSLFGEYLRRVMLLKLNNPALDLKHLHVYGSGKEVRRPNRFKGRAGVWHPNIYRHVDLRAHELGSPRSWTREEWAAVKAGGQGLEAGEDESAPAQLTAGAGEADEEVHLPDHDVTDLDRKIFERRKRERYAKLYRIHVMESAKEGLYFEDRGGKELNADLRK